MFDSHRMLVSDDDFGEGDVKYDTSPSFYSGWYPPYEPSEYILICDVGKRFSLIDSVSQVPDGTVADDIEPTIFTASYVKTTFASGYFNTPASYLASPDSDDTGYILQSIMRVGSTIGYIGTCDFTTLNLLESNIIEPTVGFVSYAFFGQYSTYYPGNMYFTSQYKRYNMQNVVCPPFNTDTYSGSNNFMVEERTETSIEGNTSVVTAVPRVAMSTNVYTQIRASDDPIGNPIYPTTSTANICIAPNVNIYPNEHDNDMHYIEIAAIDTYKPYVYSLAYPVSLTMPGSSEIIRKVIENPRNFLRDHGEYARPMVKAYHVFGYDTAYPVLFDPGMFLGFTLIALMLYKPPSFTFSIVNNVVTSDKNQIYSSGMYANTDMLFSDIGYNILTSMTTGLRHQVLRSRRGSLIVKYAPSANIVNTTLFSEGSAHPQETDDLFYFINALNPEEYMYCDGVLFGKQQFQYSTFTQQSEEQWVNNRAWSPGTQSILLKGVSITYDRGLLSNSYSKVQDANGDEKWKFDDVIISSVTHGIGGINQVSREFSYSPDMYEFRSYLSSCQAPYDVIFCDGTETVSTGTSDAVKIDGYLLAGMTSSQNLLDTIYDAIIDSVKETVTANTTVVNSPVSIEFPLEVYTIVLGTNDPEILLSAGISYQALAIFPSFGLWMKVLSGKNPVAHSIAGGAFLYDDSGTYTHFLLKQTVTVKCEYVFSVNTSEGNVFSSFSDFPFGACTSTLASANIKVNGTAHLVPLIINKLTIVGGHPTLLREIALNDSDGVGITFPKIVSYNGYVFTHSAKYVIMLNTEGVELTRDQIKCVSLDGAEHTYIDNFDALIKKGMGAYLISKYIG